MEIFYTQHREEKIILPYFQNYNPSELSFLDIGANDGIFFSNTWDLTLLGWSGCCVEPSAKAFSLLEKNYLGNTKVHLFNFGISDSNERKKFYDSGNWSTNPAPPSALSSLYESHKNNFIGMEWEETECEFVTFETFFAQSPIKKFDFISIDVEGHDSIVLNQIDLNQIGCKLICLEFSQNLDILNLHAEYCQKFGFIEIGRSLDNVLFGELKL